MRLHYIANGLIAATAAFFVGARFIPGANEQGPVLRAAANFVAGPSAPDSAHRIATDIEGDVAASNASVTSATISSTKAALAALGNAVRPLSHPRALEMALSSYFAFKTAHPAEVKKPYLYFVDYGLPSTERRGYVFDMSTLQVVDGPFTVAHGRGSSASQFGVPTRFSNASGSASSSLGLYVAREIYAFTGHTGGRSYNSTGLRLLGQSSGYNDNAFARGVVAHGAPYVTPTKAGRSEGCPAMEQQRAKRLLPKLANGGMVFLFAPDAKWMSRDPWAARATSAN